MTAPQISDPQLSTDNAVKIGRLGHTAETSASRDLTQNGPPKSEPPVIVVVTLPGAG
jgi:hypothetical protein